MRLGRGGPLAMLLLAATPARPAAASPPACPPSEAGPTPGAGSADPFRPPAPEATALNAAAKTLYRQGKWDDARAKYHAAELADPEFLAPVLNIACSFVRQDRFADATREVLRLLDRAYVPWSREILTAADLGALKVQPQMAQVRQAMAEGARRWGANLENDLLFVARQREPLKLPPAPDSPAPVVLVLGLHQEVFAWSPATGRYRQITAEDGRVLALARSLDRRTLLYVTAEKLVRNPRAPAALRGVALHTLALPTMALGASVPLEGDIGRLAIAAAAGGFTLAIEGDKTSGSFSFTGAPGRAGGDAGPDDGARAPLMPIRRRLDERARGQGLVVLTGGGVTSAPRQPLPTTNDCRLIARQGRSADGTATIEIVPESARDKHRAPLLLRPRFGAGLAGLSIP